LISETWLLVVRDLKKWVRSPAWLIASLVQPILWLVLFGNAFNPTGMIPSFPGSDSIKNSILQTSFGGAPNYITYLTAGMLCFLVITWATFAGGPLVMDRSLGYLNKLLVAPISRTAITLSLLISSILKGALLSVILILVALVLPGGLVFSLSFGVVDLLGIFAALTLLSVGFLWLFMILSVRAQSFETLAAVGSTVGLPLLFASSALLPVSSMPGWLSAIANVNPISKAVDIIRYLIIQGAVSGSVLTTVTFDFGLLTAFAVLCTLLGVVVSNRGLRME
jgi:ABC-2 type transport system permease protein